MAAGRTITFVRACVGAALLLAGLPEPTLAQPRAVVKPGQRQWVIGGWWRQAEGLPQDRVIALTQTTDGYLWVGTRGGVARFDGVRFAVWDNSSAPAPPEGEVFALVEPPDGGLWIGVYGGGLTRFKGGTFTTLTTKDGLVDNYVRSVAVATDGSVWIGTDRGLSRYRAGLFTSFHTRDGLSDETVRVVFVDPRDGTLFVGTDRGLHRLVGDRFERVSLAAATQDVTVDLIVKDRAGRMSVATSIGLLCMDGDVVQVFGPAEGLSSRTVRAVYEDSLGRMWAATNKGLDLAEVTPGHVPVFGPVIAGTDVTTVTEDQEGSIWVGYRGYGLARLQRSLFRVFDAAAGLSSSGATTVFQARNGVMWTGVGTGLAAIHGTHVDAYSTESGLPDRAVSSLAEDSTGRLWVGTEAGLFRSISPVRCRPTRCDARFVPVEGHPALRSHVRVLRPAGDAAMLVGTNAAGVFSVSTSGSTPAPSLLVPGEIRAMVVETPGRVWIGRRSGGLALWTPAGTSQVSTEEGLAHENVQTLFLDHDGTLWVGTRRGLSWLRNGRVYSATETEGLRENHVYGITDDREGRLWLSSGRGVFTVSKDVLYQFAAGSRTRLVSLAYGLEHGLPSTQCALSHDPVITTDANGHVWIATQGGLVEIDPAVQRTSLMVPPVHVESVVIDLVEFSPLRTAEAIHDRGGLVFRYAAPGFLAPQRMAFRFRLEGFDPSWIEGGSSREARFTNIPPGRYRFTVLAMNGDGVWGESGASADVYLIPHFYQRAWFPFLMAAAIVGAGAGIGFGVHRARVRRLKESERELARRVDEAVAHIKTLRGLLPVCAWCRRVRNDDGYWTQMEAYVREHSHAEISHGVCPDCMRANFPDDADTLESGGDEGSASPRA